VREIAIAPLTDLPHIRRGLSELLVETVAGGGIANGGIGTDVATLNLSNVAQQRQLNDEGRALAKSIGESLRKLRIPVGQVQTSMFQRAVDFSRLFSGSQLFGEGMMPASIADCSTVSCAASTPKYA